MVSVLDLFLKTVDKYPNKVAYIDATRSFSFAELNDVGKRIGTKIYEEVGSKKSIVIYMKKGANCIASILGSIYAGCFYTPIDERMPLERINLIFDNLHPEVIVYDDSTKDKLKELNHQCILINIDEVDNFKINEEELRTAYSKFKTTDLLYVLYTSGSTGVPKGVTINHAALIDFVEWICDKYNLDSNNSFCNQAPFYFDASVPDIFIPFKSGATVYIPPTSYYTFPKKILEYIEKNNINTLVWVPSALINVVNCKAFDIYKPQSIKLVIFCGEVMPCKQLNVWMENIPQAHYVNMYGPTEATYACTYYDIDRKFDDDEALPLGKACENSEILLIKDDNTKAETGEIGELCIAGECLSSGYYNDKEKTNKSFIQNPLNNNYYEIIYKTGDLALYNNDNELIFCGRKDFQIKKLGRRIELGEIENAILSINSIKRCCCLYNEKTMDIIAICSGEISENEITEELCKKIPEYMLPNKYYLLEEIPLNINEKIDRVLLKNKYVGE